MGRAPCCEKNGLKKGPWTPEEDQKLIDYIQRHGHGGWRTLPKNAGLSRCGKSCRLRWTNYLRPDIKRGRFSFDEEETIIQLHSILGNKWSAIAARLPGRTDNEIKNYWNTHIRRRLLRMGIDPVTHSRRLDLLDLSSLLPNQPSLMFNPQARFDVSRLLGTSPLGALGPELLRIASNLLQSQSQGSTNPLHPQIQFQDVPSCSTPASPRFFGDQSQLMQHNLHDQLQPDGHHQASNVWQAGNMNCNFRGSSAPAVTACDNVSSYEDLEQLVPQLVSDDADFYLPGNQKCYNMSMTTSVLSTPISSPATQLNSSSSTYNISGSTEDERDNYCSELFNFQIPDLLDLSDFM